MSEERNHIGSIQDTVAIDITVDRDTLTIGNRRIGDGSCTGVGDHIGPRHCRTGNDVLTGRFIGLHTIGVLLDVDTTLKDRSGVVRSILIGNRINGVALVVEQRDVAVRVGWPSGGIGWIAATGQPVGNDWVAGNVGDVLVWTRCCSTGSFTGNRSAVGQERNHVGSIQDTVAIDITVDRDTLVIGNRRVGQCGATGVGDHIGPGDQRTSDNLFARRLVGLHTIGVLLDVDTGFFGCERVDRFDVVVVLVARGRAVDVSIAIRVVVDRVVIDHVIVVDIIRGRVDVDGERIRSVVRIVIGVESRNLRTVGKRRVGQARDLVDHRDHHARSGCERASDRERR